MALSPRPSEAARDLCARFLHTAQREFPLKASLADGTPIIIRPLQPDDRQLEIDFLRGLSPRSRRLRFLCDFKQPSEALIDQLMDVDHDHRDAFIALATVDDRLIEIGVGRYCATDDASACECAITVADDWQHRGLGTLLMRNLIEEAARRGFCHMMSVDAASNRAMQALAAHFGFRRQLDPLDPTQVIHSLDLAAWRS
ncbi:MAG TPA: GNAT family N-acetyltransferase [Dyella sp.]|uniref:GNAT family N-acetyltransferase n=1 Tax=Dyella sp. TaxID=1869338 RepID=UPI002D7A3B63|nr:GNAT family N-acetyltransferase [Dyella sp.]HET6555616.1 GNAT family N-acetyltransferase [Dyella sp.]